MKCGDPVLCYTNSHKRVYRHYTLATNTFKKMAQQVFSCGQCIFCRKKKSYELASRCVLHSSLYKQNCFLTLTYDEKKPGYHNTFNYRDIQLFKKSLRTHCSRNYNGKKIEIFNVHEYGKNGKKHWHLIVFNHDFADKEIYSRIPTGHLYFSPKLQLLWPHGYNTIGDVSAASAMYQAQYIEKDFKHGYVKSNKRSHSQHSGIGKPYFLKHYDQLLNLGYIPINGHRLPIPRYFQKLAHKHYSHFYEKENFFDLPHRKKLYTPFKHGEENLAIADLFIQYKSLKAEKILELEKEWNEFIENLTFDHEPDFIKASNNTIYDLLNKQTQERF